MHYLISSLAPSPPVITTITNISRSVVHVTWTRPTVLNGALFSYTITYAINTDSRSRISVDYNGEEVSLCIHCTNLDICYTKL